MISKKTINAIHLCIYLASQRSQGYVTTAELSPRLGLSISYLESILKSLRDHHIVTAMKGPGGGYTITGDLSQISIWDVAAVFEQTCDGAREFLETEPASYEWGLEQVVKAYLGQSVLSDWADSSPVPFQSHAPAMGRFKFKPLAAPFIPQAPNSVFQLHLSL
ncbi:MAG: RrF2 family transcriptional regulator [Limnohabitans sp.]